MAELQLKLVKNTDNGVFGKAINNFNKVLYSSGGGFFNIIINGKRNGVLKAYANFWGCGYQNLKLCKWKIR